MGDDMTGGGLAKRTRALGDRITGGGLRSLAKRLLATLTRWAMGRRTLLALGRAVLKPFPKLTTRLCQLATAPDPFEDDEIARMSYVRVIGDLPPPQHPPVAPRRRSELCKLTDFSLDAYRYWSSVIGLRPTLHRKNWEFFYICQALYERGLLDKGRVGLGFGVGQEPLPAVFASVGCAIVATDQTADDAIGGGWARTGQHADSLAALEKPHICPPATFRERVSFEAVDMNNIPAHLAGRFDFCWSACCFEHLGSLEHGLRFVRNSIDTLKLGGVAVHTTEFNLSSDADTLESQELSIYRKRDIEALFSKLQRAGHRVEPLNLDKGSTLIDSYVDLPPYHGEPHLRLRLGEYDCTSIGIIITRGQ